MVYQSFITSSLNTVCRLMLCQRQLVHSVQLRIVTRTAVHKHGNFFFWIGCLESGLEVSKSAPYFSPSNDCCCMVKIQDALWLGHTFVSLRAVRSEKLQGINLIFHYRNLSHSVSIIPDVLCHTAFLGKNK